MEFGIFSQMHVPPDETEHSRFMRTVDVSMACDAAGIKYDWAPEHDFLTSYSHQPAPECYAELSFQWLDSIPRPPGVPATGPIRMPAPTPQALEERLDRGEALCGSPEEIIPVLRQWEAMGVDQIIFSPLTKRLREAAAAARAA